VLAVRLADFKILKTAILARDCVIRGCW